MAAKFEIAKMTTEEKLQAMEMLWDDICRNVPDFSSPAWHGQILKERERQAETGQQEFLDWDQVKEDIRKSI